MKKKHLPTQLLALVLAGLGVHACSEDGDGKGATGGTGGATGGSGGGTGGGPDASSGGGGGGAAGGGGNSGSAGAGGSGGAAGGGGDASVPDADAGSDSGTDAASDADAAACKIECGATELCDLAHAGFDDDCDGDVDEGCPCVVGTAQACFKGDPAYRGTSGCHDGVQVCSAQATWGLCAGGLHGTDQCFTSPSPADCAPLTGQPFVPVKLADGSKGFGADAVPGSESWSVQCPPSLAQCPQPTGLDKFQPLESGEYTVNYSKLGAGSQPGSCKYPLFVRGPGLRVELSWEHKATDDGADLDLHLHQPGDSKPWALGVAAAQDCGWGNCSIKQLTSTSAMPSWFPGAPAVPPAPVGWWLDPVGEQNTCYYAPQGKGQAWKQNAKGCHNPRLDLERTSCKSDVKDPDSLAFCSPENVNIDFPPTGKWMRIGVHYHSNGGIGYDVHPRVKVFCDGALRADLGPDGFYTPAKPVTFASSDGANTGSGNRFWPVADVGFVTDACGSRHCVVSPVYASATTRAAYFATDIVAESAFLPAYPPGP